MNGIRRPNPRHRAALAGGLMMTVVCSVMLALPATVAADDAPAGKHTLVIGKVSDNPK